jgi:signal transduction histidine kinase
MRERDLSHDLTAKLQKPTKEVGSEAGALGYLHTECNPMTSPNVGDTSGGSKFCELTNGLSCDILDSLSSGILAVDLDGRVLFVNAALSRRLTIAREEWVGKPALGLFGTPDPRIPSKRTPLYRLHPRLKHMKSEYRDIEWIDRKKVVHLREDSSPLCGNTGQLIGRLFAYHDLSWEKTIDQMKSDFISVASHELRTPMTSIKGSVDLILAGCAGKISPETMDLLQVARSACDRMIRLINNILDLSKIEAGQMQLRLELVDLTDVAERSLRTINTLAAQADVTFKRTFPNGLPLVKADRDRIEQVITNLLSNAIKFSPPRGEIGISISADRDWVRCIVSDQGCGIAEKDLSRIFGKFQQGGLPQRGAGTGLGLAITHALITEHRGKVWVESRIGEGSRFGFCLPVHS